MGIELDVLVGHPEHELLFVATQVANAAGMKDGRGTAKAFIRAANRASVKVGLQMRDLANGEDSSLLTEAQCIEVLPYPRWRDTWVMAESDVYQMLLRGHSPRSEPFRRWVTEEVLPTIRKTGSYDASKSESPIAVGVMDADVAKPLTMAALPQRPQEDHLHDQLRSSTTRGDHYHCTLHSQAWPRPPHQDHHQLVLRRHRTDHGLRSISPLRNGHP